MRAFERPTATTCLFFLFLLLASFTTSVRADDEKDVDEYEETARVARVRLMRLALEDLHAHPRVRPRA